MKAMMNKLAYVAIAMIGIVGLVWAQEQVDPPSAGTVVSQDTITFAFGDYPDAPTHAGTAEDPWPYTGVGGEPGAMYTNENNEVIFVGGKPDTNATEPWQTLEGLNPKPTKGYFPKGKVTPEELAEYGAKGGFTATDECIEYYTWDEATKTLVPQGCTVYTVVADTTETLNSGWYVVQGTVVIDRSEAEKPGLKVNGDVHLILADGAELVVTGAMDCAGIEVNVAESVTNSLTIYGQQGQSGKLTVTGGGGAAGLGGSENQPCGTVTINGGVVETTGGRRATGIGTGMSYHGQEVGLLVINAGTVTATAGASNEEGSSAGIGGAADSHVGITVIINGGTVSATGGALSAGIGGSFEGKGCDVTINGGKVRAVSYGEYIGIIGGAGAGIGGGMSGNGGSVTINGGEVIAISYAYVHPSMGTFCGDGIGAGASMDPATSLSSGTLNLSGYEGVKILAGMDTNGLEVTEVAAADYLDHDDVIGWHTNCYVHILKGEAPAEAIGKLDFTLVVTEPDEGGKTGTVTMDLDAPLADGEIWAWITMDVNDEKREQSLDIWKSLNGAIGKSVGTINLLQVTNGMNEASFGTFSTTPFGFGIPSGDTMVIFARVREATGEIVSVGGVKNHGRVELGGSVTCENLMLGTGRISVAYYAWDEEAKDVVLQEPVNAIQLTDDVTEMKDGEWYVAIDDWDYCQQIVVSGHAHLICRDNSFSAFRNILTVSPNSTLSVYGTSKVIFADDPVVGLSTFLQPENLVVAENGSINLHGSRICTYNLTCGTINVYGGSLEGSGSDGCPAIHVFTALNVYGGWVFADSDGTGVAGIGGAAGQDGCTVNVYGGTVEAHGGENAAGIGAGADGASHGDLHVAEGLNVWVAEEQESTKVLASNYNATRDRHVWITALSEKVSVQDFTVTKDESKVTVNFPGEPGEGYCWGIVKMSKFLAEMDLYGDGCQFAEDMIASYSSEIAEGSSLVGEKSFAWLTSVMEMLVTYRLIESDDFEIVFGTGDSVDIPIDASAESPDAMLICKVVDNDNHGIVTLGGCTHLMALAPGESKRNEVTDGTVPTTYYAWNGEEVTGPFATNAIPVTADMTELNSGWYVVQGEVTMDHGLVINGDVHLILEDGASLKITTDVSLNCPPIWYKQAVPVSLSVYGQVAGTGLLEADATTSGCTAIGNGSNEALTGKFNLHGGKVIAKASLGSAGIGSGDRAYSSIDEEGWFDGFAVNVYGGQLTAVAGLGGAGIGCGAQSVAPRCAVNVLGGEVFASGSDISAVAEGMWTPAIGWGYQTETKDPYANCALIVGSDMAIWAGNDNSSGDFSGLSLTTVEDYCKDSPRLMYVHIAKAVVEGSPENPWDVGTNGNGQPAAYTNGTGTVIVKGDGEPKTFGEGEEPWAGAVPEITEIIVPVGRGPEFKEKWPLLADLIKEVPDYLSFTSSWPTSNPEDFVIEDGVLTYYKGLDAEVAIPEGVTVIGARAFFDMKWVERVYVPKSVKNIAPLAFAMCGALEDVLFEQGTELESIEASAFAGAGIKSIAVPDSVKTVGSGAFNGCTALTKVWLGNGLETIAEDAFYDPLFGMPEEGLPIEVIYVPTGKGDAYKAMLCEALKNLVVETAESVPVFEFGSALTCTTDAVEPLPLEWTDDPVGGTWTDIEYGVELPLVAGKTIFLRKKGGDVALSANGLQIKLSGNAFVEAHGNVMSLLDQSCQSVTVGEQAFSRLFKECAVMTTAPKLPATTLARGCYDTMFYQCTLLMAAPELPATKMEMGCYANMFGYCASLRKAPELPATKMEMGCYANMFCECASLMAAPELPATTLAPSCYNGMFWSCTSLTNAPVLSASTLEQKCYYSMFGSCASLTKAPVLPAMTLAPSCYQGMFARCTALTNAPSLPVTELAATCYANMFADCTALTNAPALQATTLADGCYQGMFSGCTALANAPELPATTLADGCYQGMFSGCTLIDFVSVGFANWMPSTATEDWLQGVAETGTFKCKWGLDVEVERGASTIPVGWTVDMTIPDGCYANPWDVGTNGNGQPAAYTNGNNEVVVTGEGLPKPYGGEGDPAPWAGFDPEIETIYVPQNTEDIYKHQWPDDADKIVGVPDYLSFTAKDGDVTIAFGKTYAGTYGLEYSFDPIANDWDPLPEFDLNGTADDSDKVLVPNGQTLYIRKMGDEVTLGVGAYGKKGTFQMERVENTTATVEAGGNVMSLLDKTCRSKEVDSYAFYYLFCDCRILTAAPKLPATRLGVHCYEFMFDSCSALKAAPELPATELESGCYCYMFYGCSALESIELPASELKEACYRFMFQFCSKLSMVKVGFDAWSDLANVCEDWLLGVAETGTFICSQALENNFAAKGLSYGASTIPVNWRVARDYLSFTAKGGDITLTLNKVHNPQDVAFEFFDPVGNRWNFYGVDAETGVGMTILIEEGQTFYFRKQGSVVPAISTGNGNYWKFSFDGEEGATVAAGGNVMSLLDPTCQSREIGNYGLCYLFLGCDRLVSAPRVDADAVMNYGCEGMFYGCTSLTTAPVIGGGKFAKFEGYSFDAMFREAKALSEITVDFTDWNGGYPTHYWVQDVAPFGVFRCPSELPIEVDESHIPEGWIVYKKFSIPAIKGLSHSVTDLVTGEEIVPCGVSQDGTKTYEVLAGGEDKYLVLFEDVEGYPVAGTNPLDLGDLSDSVEIGSDKYPLPERGVLLTVEGAPEHSKFTIYCNEEVFAEGPDELTTRVPANVTTKVVYSTTDDGWAYAFENGQPVTEQVRLEDYVTNPTEVSAPTELPDNYKQVLEKVAEFEKTASESLETMRVTYGLAVVDVEVQEKQAGIQAWVTMIKANPLPSSETLVQVEQAKDDFDAWCAQLKTDADEFVAALKEAEEKTKAAGAELTKLGPTKYYEEKGAALIKTAQADVDKIKTDGKPPVKDQTANLQNAMKKFDADFEMLTAEIAAFKQAKAEAEKKLTELIKNNDELLKNQEIAYRWGKMEASKDPAVQNYVGDIVFSMMGLKNGLDIMRSELDAAQNTDDVSKISEDATKANDTLEDIRTRILSYQIPEYTLTVNVVHPDQVSYSVYTGETVQVAIVEKLSQTDEFHFVWETPVKVVYHLTDDGYAFDAAKSKTERDFVALDAIKEMMQHDRKVDEPALGNLKDLVGTYDGVKGQFDAWEKDAAQMPEELKGQIQIYIDGGRKTAENLYTIGVPVGETCEKINVCKDEVWSKIEPLFKQGYQQLAAERGYEFKDKYSQFLDENAERINEISQYGTPEAAALIAQVDQLKNNCEALINQINSGSIDNKTAYEALLTGKQKLETEMDDLAKQLSEAIRYVTALPISADRDFNGSVIVRSTQGRISGEQAWLCLWFPKYLEDEAILKAEQLIGRKFREIPAEELYQWCGGDCIIEDSAEWFLGNRYLPEDMTACVIVAIDEKSRIMRIGGIVGLDELAPGEVKGADIACGGAMSISYYESKEGNLFQQTAMAMPLTSGDSVTLAGERTCYAVLGDCEIPVLTVKGDVWLILGRGCDLSVLDGIVLTTDATLHICSEHYFLNEPHLTGRMTVAKTGVDKTRPAAIYGQVNRSWLEIHGGVIDISSDTAGIGVANFRMANGDVTVTGGESYAGIYLDSKAKAQCRVEAGTLNVTGGAGAAAIGGNAGRDGGSFEVLGGLVRADATPTEHGKCGASIGAGVGSIRHNQFVLGNNLSIFTAENATSKMQITDAKIYDKMRHPSVLITTGTELIQPLPFTLNKNGNYNLQMPGLPRSQYAVFALAKDDLARAYGEGSTVGAEIWKTVSRIATGARVAVGEITRASLERSLHEMGVKTIYISYSQIDICDVYPYGDIAMIVTFDCDEQGQVVRLGGIHVPDSMTDGSTIESTIGREAIGGLTFQVIGEDGKIKLQNLSEEPNEDEGEKFMLCCYTKEKLAAKGVTEEAFAAAAVGYIGREVGTAPVYFFSDMADYKSSDREFDQGLYTVVFALITDSKSNVRRIGVVTGIETMTDGQSKDSDVALIGAQSFTVRADNSDWATIQMPGWVSQGQAWLWARVSDETMYEELDTFINGLIGQPVGAEGATLRPLDASAIPAMFGSGNWGIFTGYSVEIRRYDAMNGNPMRGVMVFKVATLPTTETGNEMMILTAGGVKNVDKLIPGQELSNQYGEDVEHIANQPLTVTRQGDDKQSLLVVPEGELPENGSWHYLPINPDFKIDLGLDARLLTYLGAAVGDLTLNTLGNWGCWPSSTTESSFTVPGDTEAVYLFKVDASGAILTIGLADELKKLYEPGMSKGDTFGKTFIAAQDFGVTRAGEVLTASVYERDAIMAEDARDRFICFTYEDEDVTGAVYRRMAGIVNGTTEVGAYTLASLDEVQPKMIGTFTTDELSLELPAGYRYVFVARVHGADDTIVTLGGVPAGDVADGETRQPNMGLLRVRPFLFTVTREENGTFALETQSRSRPDEQWMWVAVPPHVRYVMEQKYESSERLLELLRREMVVASARTGRSLGKSEFLASEMLQVMLGEGYYGTSLDTELSVDQIPADTEVVMVFKFDRATGGLRGEGAVIDLDQLAVGEAKQNQVDGMLSYMDVDAGGNRTLKETEVPVEPITELTASIGGGRWYVLTDLNTVDHQTGYIGKNASKRITVDGEANIILLDSGMGEETRLAVLNGGFAVNEGATLNIYGQQAGNGMLQVTGADGCAAIGGDEGCGCGTINLYGGVVVAEAGVGAAAIGGGYMNGDKNGSVNLYGGIVMAVAGDAAAIGGGRFGRGCNVCIYPAATLFCPRMGEEETVGVGGCDGLENGAVVDSGENRVYLEADEAFTPHPYGYYFGDVRRGNFVATELLTVSLPKDERLRYYVESLTLGGDFGGVLTGDDAYTYRVLRGDTIVVMAETIGKDGLVNYGFRGPYVFKFDCVQSDVTLSADDLKVAPSRGVTPMDFTVNRDKFGQLSLRSDETFAPGEQLVWAVIPEGAKLPTADPMIGQLLSDPVSAINMLLGQGLFVGEATCDQYVMMLGAKNWNIVFDYAGEAIPLPENTKHVMAFKVFDIGRYVALAKSGEKILKGAKKKVDGRMALIKVGAIDNVAEIQPEKPLHNQVSDNILIARQPFVLTRNADETFQLTLVGRLNDGIGEKWGLATINSEKLAMIESGALGDLTLEELKMMLDGMIGRPIGTLRLTQMSPLFSTLETSGSNVFTCPNDTEIVVAFKTCKSDKGDFICTLGYTFSDLQAMAPGGTERKGNEIDGETDAPTYFVTIENIPEDVKGVNVTYAIGEDGPSVNLSPDILARTAQFAVPEGADVEIEFVAAGGKIFRTKDSVKIKAIHQDEIVDASFLVLTDRNRIEPQHFILRRNADKTFAMEMPEYGLDAEKGDRWFYLALNANDMAMSFSDGQPAGAVVWLLANSMLGQQVGSSDRVTTAYFTSALRDGYSGYTAERFFGLPADAEMVIVCRCFDVTAEDGFTITYVETVGGCQNLQQTGEYDVRDEEMNYPSGGEMFKVNYVKWDKSKSTLVPGGTVVARVIDDDMTTIGNDQWYVVPPMEEVTCGTITVQGTANVIVGDMATFELDNFVVEAGATLNVYGQGQRLGTMIVGGDGVSIGSGTACGTINLHGVTVMVEGEAVGIGGMSEGGELNVLGANMLVMAYGPAIAGCTVNAYGGRVLAASMSGGDYPAINDGLAIKNSKMGLFASANPAALEPTKVADYLENRQPFAKIVEQVNIILPKVEHAKVTVAAQDVITGELSKFEPEDLPGADWLIYKVERFDNVMVEIAAESGYELRSPAEYLFYSIDSDKQLPADAIVVAESNWPPTQFIARQPFSIFRETDGDGSYCVLKPVGELGPGERWFWMSCDRTLAQTTGTVDGFKDMTTERAVIEMLNSAIGRAPVGYLSLDEYGLRTQLPVNQSGVGTDATFRLPADTDLVLLSKVYDGGLQDEGMVRYFNITLGLSTNLTVRMEGGDSGHNDIGEEPTEEEIKNALEDAFPDPHEVTQNEDGSFRITLMEDMTGPVAIPDNLGEIVLDMNGFHITGTNGFNGADGGNALVFTDSGDVGPTTELTIVEAGEKYNPEGDIVGGNGADGKKPGKGGAAIRVDTKRGVTINVEGTVLVIGGKGGTLLDGDKGTKPGNPGKGIDPQDTRGDRAPGSVDEGEWGEELSPWAKATLAAEAPDNLQTRLPEGVTAVGNELWFWKRTGEGAIGFDFRTIEMRWIDDRMIRFAAGTYLVDQFTYGEDGEIVFVGADSAAVVVEDAPFTPVKPEEKPDKPVLEAVVVGNKGPELPDLGKYTVLVSTGKSIFKSTQESLLMAVGPLGKSARGNISWRNLGFTALPGTVFEGNGGTICAENVVSLTVADCAFRGLTADQMGGAIYAVGLSQGALITNSTFTACSVSDANGMGGAIYAVGGRAPLLAAGSFGKPVKTPQLTVVDCVFTLNEAESGGAICTTPMYEDEDPIDLVIAGTTFGGNTAHYNGGAICACGKVTIADAEADRGTFFAYNEAGIYGGALAIDGVEEDVFNSMVSVGSNTVFACNMVTNDWVGEAFGGAINLPEGCSLFVRNAMFTNNVAACNGGSVYGVYGGAICTASGCSNIIEKTYFVDNRAIADGSAGDRSAAGGALSDVDGALTFVDTCVFDGNTVEGMAVFGAALDLEYDIESAVVNSTFRRSNVEAVSAYATPVVIRNCVIVDNGADADLWIEAATGYELTFTAYGKLVLAEEATEIASSNNLENCVAAEVYRGETVYLATNEYNKVAALGYPQPGVTDIEGVEYGSKFWGTSMGAFETPAIYPVEELGFEITVDPLELAWTGMKVHPTSIAVTNPFTRAELTEGVDYTVSFENDVNSTDKAQVIVTGIGNYSGVATTNYWITSYLVKYYACEMEEGAVTDRDRPLETVELGSLSGSNVVAKIVPPAGYVLDPFHAGSKTNGVVSLYDSASNAEANGRLVLRVYYAKSSGGDDDIPDKYQRKITYKVVNGWWDNPVNNGLDQTVWVTLYDGDGNWSENGTGTLSGIPTVGNTPFAGYAKTGVWYPATPTTVEMPITRTSPSTPFFLYVYCAQPQGGGGRGGRHDTHEVTQADLDALTAHLQTKFNLKNFSVIGPNVTGVIEVGVVDQTTGHLLASDLLEGAKVNVKSTTDLMSGEWSTDEVPTDGKGQFSIPKPEGVNQLFLQVESVEK